jgi:hypothetical protein
MYVITVLVVIPEVRHGMVGDSFNRRGGHLPSGLSNQARDYGLGIFLFVR